MPVRPLSTRARLSSRTKPNHARSNRGQLNRTQPNRVQPNRVQPDSTRSSRINPHQVICADCGTPTTVPFLPTSGKPVYCRSCFSNRRGGPSPVADKHFDEPSVENETPLDAVYGNGPVFSEMPLKDATRAAISRMNISQPTPIQEKAIPHLLEGRDVKGQARTGSGKTLAFAVPMAEKCDPAVRRGTGPGAGAHARAGHPGGRRSGGPGVAAETPRDAAIRRPVPTAGVHGVTERFPHHHRDPRGVPWTTCDKAPLTCRQCDSWCWMRPTKCLTGASPRTLNQFSIAHLPIGRRRSSPRPCQTGWPKPQQKHMREPITVALDARLQAPPTVEHLIYTIQKSDKLAALQTLLDQREGAPVLVFGKTKHGVKHLAQQLAILGYPVGALQGNLSQVARERVMKDFRSGSTPILVATNVAARGLDIDGIGRVINYDLPDSEQLFTHRVGRTGRMGRAGEAVTFITIDEERKWREIERGLGRRFTRKPWNAVRKATQPRIKVSS